MKTDFGSALLGEGVGVCMPSPRTSCCPSVADGPVIRSKSAEELLSYDFLMALAERIDRLGLSQERTMTWLYVTLRLWNGTFEDCEGKPLIIRDGIFDRAYSKDSGFDWHSDVKKFVKRPPKRRPKKSLLTRFMLWDLAFAVANDPIALPVR